MPLPVTRTAGRDTSVGKLFFANVREDSAVEAAALAPVRTGRIAVITSGGCHALTLLAGGAEVVAVDGNATQNDVLELKTAALVRLDRDDALAFLGVRPASPAQRQEWLVQLTAGLNPETAQRWQRAAGLINPGVIRSGITERFLTGAVGAVKRAALARGAVSELLRAPDTETQRRIYDRSWDTRRWRAAIAMICNRKVFDKVYDETFFERSGRSSFAEHFQTVFRHGLTELPVAENPYAHEIFGGGFGDVLPPWLTAEAVDGIQAGVAENRLSIVDDSLTDWLAGQRDGSLDGVVLSNIAEWLDASQRTQLFHQLARVIRPGGVVVLRNFVGWTELPEQVTDLFDANDGETAKLSSADRSLMQFRTVALHRRSAPRDQTELAIRDLNPADGPALRRLAQTNPVRSATRYYVDRSNCFSMIGALDGRLLAVSEPGGVELAAACCLIPVTAQATGAGGAPVEVSASYVGGLVANPRVGGAGARLAATVRDLWADSGRHVVTWLTNNDNERVRRVAAKVQPASTRTLSEVDYTEVMPLSRAVLPQGWRLTTPSAENRTAVLDFVNHHYRDHGLYSGVQEADITRLPGASEADLVALHNAAGDLVAAAWVWDPRDSVRVVPVRFDRLTRIWERGVAAARAVGARIPDAPHEHRPIHTLHLRRLAFADDQAGRIMIGQLGNRVIDSGAQTLSYVDSERARIPRTHRMVLTYPARVDAAFAPDAPVSAADLQRRPLFVDITLT